jgi:hypothetical protein
MLFVGSYEFSFSHDVLRGKAFELGTQQINYVQNLCCSLDSLRVNYYTESGDIDIYSIRPKKGDADLPKFEYIYTLNCI